MPGRSADSFDLAAHHRKRIRQLEAHCDHLDAYRTKLERLLGQALTIATANTNVTPRALLELLDDLDNAGVKATDLADKQIAA